MDGQEDKPRLTAKQEQFCQEYLIDLNATQAAIRAGYSENAAAVEGCRLLTNANVQDRVAELQLDRSKRTRITQDMVLVELARLGFSDIRKVFTEHGSLVSPTEWDAETAAAIASVEVVTKPSVDEDGNKTVEYVHKIKTWDKNSALEKLAKHLGMFVERKEIGRPGDFSNLSNEQLVRRAEALGVPVDDIREALLASGGNAVH